MPDLPADSPVNYRSAKTSRRRSQQGYAILMVLFFVALLFITAMSVAPNILTQGRREKEAEMIWRGKQYVRGIKLYYRKNGKFPTTLDDLTKPHAGNIRFMRQAYKDPMNPKDGEWRLIYVGPAGQLIGSLNPQKALQTVAFGGAMGPVPGTPASQIAAQSSGQAPGGAFGQGFGQGLNQAAGQIFGNTGSLQQPNGNGNFLNTPPAQGGSALGQQNPVAGSPDAAAGSGNAGNVGSASASPADSAGSDATNEALLNAESTTVIGGNIIGVGSKINQRSITVYEKAKNYKRFEFIWDPSKDAISFGGAAGPQIGTPAGTPGNPLGQPIGNTPGQNFNNPNAPNGPLNPPPSPPDTTPNSPQQP